MGYANRSRRSRIIKGGAHAIACGLGCETALITGPVRRLACAGLVLSVFLSWTLPDLTHAQAVSQHSPTLTPLDILWEIEGDIPTLVVRFVVPDIARKTATLSYDEAAPLMDRLCAQVALPAILNTGSTIEQILVILMDRPIPRGQAMPDATQFINIYSILDGHCIWEDF